MLIKSKSLSDTGWKDIVARHKVKDNGLLKVLEKLKKFGDDEHDEALKALEDATRLAAQLRKDKTVSAAPPATRYIGELISSVESSQREIGSAKADADRKALAQAEKTAAEAARTDEGEEGEGQASPELLGTRMKPLLKLVAKGEAMHALVAKSGNRVVVMLSRKPIPSARRKLLQEQLGGGSTKYYPGHCTSERGATTFVLNAEVAGLAKLVKAALLEQTGLRIKAIKCRGVDGDDDDEDDEDDLMDARLAPESGAGSGAGTPAAEPLRARADAVQQAALAWNESTAAATSELRKLQQAIRGLGDARAAAVAEGLESIVKRLDTVDDEAEAAASAARAEDAGAYAKARDTLVAKLRNIESYVEADELIKDADANPLVDIRLSETLGRSIKAILKALA